MTEFTAHPDGTAHTGDLGEVNFTGYATASDGRSLVSGDPLPGFAAMPAEIQRAWRAGARSVVRHVVRHVELRQSLAALRRLADPEPLAGDRRREAD